MEHLIHRTPSVGTILKKIMAINPELSAPEMIGLIRQSIRAQDAPKGFEFAQAEIIDEPKCLELARATLQRK